jgi:hypothetical protein
MRSFPSIWRVLAKAKGLVVPCLLVLACASAADAAPRVRHHITVRNVSSRLFRLRQMWSPRTVGTRKALRRSFLRRLAVGPVNPPSPRAQAGLIDTFAEIRRATRVDFDDDDAAIQNDAPAAHIDHDDTTRPSLRPLERLIPAADRLPLSSPFLPRSPRGPPAAA